MEYKFLILQILKLHSFLTVSVVVNFLFSVSILRLWFLGMIAYYGYRSQRN